MRVTAGAEFRDGCCEEGEWTSAKMKIVKLGRGCEEGEWTSAKMKKIKLGQGCEESE